MGRVSLLAVEECEVTGRSDLDYVLHPDGKWYPSVRGITTTKLPVLDVVGPDRESIVLHLQELRDELGMFDAYTIRIEYGRWISDRHLRVALLATPRGYRPGRIPLMEALLHLRGTFQIPDWETQRALIQSAIDEAKTTEDQESVRDVCAIIASEAEE
jgi:hypothetical protein